MNNRIIRNLITPVIIASTVLTFAGCSNGLKDKIESGITCLNNGQYEEAQDEFEAVLEKDPDNSQAKTLNEIIIKFISATEEYKNDNLEKAKEYLDKIPNEYADYSIKDAVDDLKKNVNDKLANIENFSSSLTYISNLVKDNKLDEANKEIEKLNTENIPREKVKALEDLKGELNLKLVKRSNEEKLEKERAEASAAASEALKKKNEEKKPAPSASKEQGNILYQNKKLGIQMKFPRTWEGLYRIKETDTSIYVFTKQQVQHFEGEGFLFAITKWYSGMDEGVIDTISRNKRYIVAKGVKYIIGGPTGVMESDDDPDWNNYRMMDKDKSNVADTIEAID